MLQLKHLLELIIILQVEDLETSRVPKGTSISSLYLMEIRGSLNVVMILKNKILLYNKKVIYNES